MYTVTFEQTRLTTAEKILVAEYDLARAALSQWQRSPERYADGDRVVERCITAMRRLRMFLTDREIPDDIERQLGGPGDGQAAAEELRRQVAQSAELTSIGVHLGQGVERGERAPDLMPLRITG
jgi:hypothetical protein